MRRRDTLICIPSYMAHSMRRETVEWWTKGRSACIDQEHTSTKTKDHRHRKAVRKTIADLSEVLQAMPESQRQRVFTIDNLKTFCDALLDVSHEFQTDPSWRYSEWKQESLQRERIASIYFYLWDRINSLTPILFRYEALGLGIRDEPMTKHRPEDIERILSAARSRGG
jgi:hypothetical protein